MNDLLALLIIPPLSIFNALQPGYPRLRNYQKKKTQQLETNPQLRALRQAAQFETAGRPSVYIPVGSPAEKQHTLPEGWPNGQ